MDSTNDSFALPHPVEVLVEADVAGLGLGTLETRQPGEIARVRIVLVASSVFLSVAILQCPTGSVNNTLPGTATIPRKRTLSRAPAVTQSLIFLAWLKLKSTSQGLREEHFVSAKATVVIAVCIHRLLSRTTRTIPRTTQKPLSTSTAA